MPDDAHLPPPCSRWGVLSVEFDFGTNHLCPPVRLIDCHLGDLQLMGPIAG